VFSAGTWNQQSHDRDPLSFIQDVRPRGNSHLILLCHTGCTTVFWRSEILVWNEFIDQLRCLQPRDAPSGPMEHLRFSTCLSFCAGKWSCLDTLALSQKVSGLVTQVSCCQRLSPVRTCSQTWRCPEVARIGSSTLVFDRPHETLSVNPHSTLLARRAVCLAYQICLTPLGEATLYYVFHAGNIVFALHTLNEKARLLILETTRGVEVSKCILGHLRTYYLDLIHSPRGKGNRHNRIMFMLIPNWLYKSLIGFPLFPDHSSLFPRDGQTRNMLTDF
jgi:hypothetical protein